MKRGTIRLEDLKNSACAHLNKHLFESVAGKKKKRPKYNNEKVVVDDIEFASKKEAHRYGELKLLMKAGEIGMLEMQVAFLLIPASETERKCEYLADFVYRDMRTGEKIVEDVKSEITRKLPAYIMKRKLMLSVHGIKIVEK